MKCVVISTRNEWVPQDFQLSMNARLYSAAAGTQTECELRQIATAHKQACSLGAHGVNEQDAPLLITMA